jgi:hypothetical protein
MYKKLFAAPLALSLTLSAVAPTFAHAEEVTPTTTQDTAVTTTAEAAVTVKPVISFKGVATSSYDNNFTNVSYVKEDTQYKVTMNVDPLFTTFKLNGEEVALEKDGETQKVTFTLADINVNPTITIGYTAMGYAASHDFKFDFTPSIDEVTADIEAALAALTYTSNDKVKDATSYKAAVKELGYVDTALKYKVGEEAITLDVSKNANYASQKAAIEAYKAPFVKAVTEAAAKLTYTKAETIKTADDVAKAEAQLKAATDAETAAIAAGLTAKTDLANAEHYANIAAQKAVVTAANTTTVTPVISYKNVPTAQYNDMFANTTIVKEGTQYTVTMDVSNLFTLFQMEGQDVTLTKGATEEDPQKATFTIDSLESNPTINIAYSAGPMGTMSHEFTFDFTPTTAEYKTVYDQAIAALSYVGADTVTSQEALTAAQAQLTTVDNIIASATKSLTAEAASDFVKTDAYTAQQANVATYKTPFITALKEKTSALTFVSADKITTTAQLKEATAQLVAAQEAETAAVAAGLAARTDLAKVEGYANIAAQKAAIEAKETARTLTVKVSNAKGAADIVKVAGVQAGDTVRVYDAEGKVIATKTAKAENITFTKLNIGKKKGTLSITAQGEGRLETEKVATAFKAEPVSKAIAKASVTVKNNKGKNDIVTIKGTVKGEKVRVYDAQGKTLKTVTATGKTTKVSIKQLGKKAGKIQVARIQVGKHISAKTTVKFSKEK